jgi:hypothetical protein
MRAKVPVNDEIGNLVMEPCGSGLLNGRFIGRSRVHWFGLLVISEETEGFVWVPIRQSNIGPSFGSRTATRMDVDDGMRGRVAGAVANFAERHFASPTQSYTSTPGKRVTGNVGTST